jgi:predicted DNA-binding protein (UPF0251 family)
VEIEMTRTELSPLQIQAIRALLSERTYKTAAAKVGVSRVTLWRWLKQPAFKQVVLAGLQAQKETILTDIRARHL